MVEDFLYSVGEKVGPILKGIGAVIWFIVFTAIVDGIPGGIIAVIIAAIAGMGEPPIWLVVVCGLPFVALFIWSIFTNSSGEYVDVDTVTPDEMHYL